MEQDFAIQVHPKVCKVLTLAAPSWMHKYIIGKGGETLRNLTNNSPKIKVEFRKDDKVVLTGPSELITPVSKKIQASYIDKYTDFIELTVDPTKVHSVIGRNGRNIEKVHQETRANINVNSNNIIRIEGTKSSVLSAKQAIKEKAQHSIVIDCTPWAINKCLAKLFFYKEQYPEVQIRFPLENQIELCGQLNEVKVLHAILLKEYVDVCIELLIEDNTNTTKKILKTYNQKNKAYLQKSHLDICIWGTASDVEQALADFHIEQHHPHVCVEHAPLWVHKHINEQEVRILKSYPDVIVTYLENEEKITITGPYVGVAVMLKKIRYCIKTYTHFIEFDAASHLFDEVFDKHGETLKDIQADTHTIILLHANGNSNIRIEGTRETIQEAKTIISAKLEAANEKNISMLLSDGYFHPEYVKITIDCSTWVVKNCQSNQEQYKEIYPNVRIAFFLAEKRIILIASKNVAAEVNVLHKMILKKYVQRCVQEVIEIDVSDIIINEFNKENGAYIEAMGNGSILLSGTLSQIHVAKLELANDAITINCSKTAVKKCLTNLDYYTEQYPHVKIGFPENRKQIILRGRKDDVNLVREEILQYVEPVSSSGNLPPPFEMEDSLEFQIEPQCIGFIIGKDGCRINPIQSETCTHIYIAINGTVRIRGSKDGILEAKFKIIDVVDFWKRKNKNKTKNDNYLNKCHPEFVLVTFDCTPWTIKKCVSMKAAFKKQYPNVKMSVPGSRKTEDHIKLEGKIDEVSLLRKHIRETYIDKCEVKLVDGINIGNFKRKAINRYNSLNVAVVKITESGDMLISGTAEDINHAIIAFAIPVEQKKTKNST